MLQTSHYFAYVMTHYSDVIMNAVASQISHVSIVFSTVYLGADQSKYQSSSSLGFVRGHSGFPSQKASNV